MGVAAVVPCLYVATAAEGPDALSLVAGQRPGTVGRGHRRWIRR